MKNFLKNIAKNPQTSAAGIATLLAIGFAAAAQPSILAAPQTITAIFTGIGLLAAGDPTKTTTTDTTKLD